MYPNHTSHSSDYHPLGANLMDVCILYVEHAYATIANRKHRKRYLDVTLGNLGGDTKSLEETSLRRLHTSGTRLKENAGGSDGASLGTSDNLVLLEDLTDLLGVGVGEHKTNVEADGIGKLVKSGLGGGSAADHVLWVTARDKGGRTQAC